VVDERKSRVSVFEEPILDREIETAVGKEGEQRYSADDEPGGLP
jgi:hypothetical protein